MKKINLAVMALASTMFIFTGCTNTFALDHNQPSQYKAVIDSYLPDGYQVDTEWKNDNVNSYRGKSGNTTYRRYSVYYAYYADANDRLHTDDPDECIIMDSMRIEANQFTKDEAMADSIREALSDNISRLIDKEVKTKYYIYGTQIYKITFDLTDAEILDNVANVNLAKMTWDDVKNLKATIVITDVVSGSIQYSEEEIRTAMEELANTIENASGVTVEFVIEK